MAKRGNPHLKPGPGIPKGYKYPSTVIREKAREQLHQIVFRHWEPIVITLVMAAKGYTKKEKHKDKNGKEYEVEVIVPPSESAAKTLIEFISGKAIQPLEHSGDVGSPEIAELAASIKAIAERKAK